MKTIYKYSVAPSHAGMNIKLPKGARVLTIGEDGFSRLSFWAYVDTDQPLEERTIYCVGTGWDLDYVINPDGRDIDVFWCGSTTTEDGMVWHLLMEE